MHLIVILTVLYPSVARYNITASHTLIPPALSIILILVAFLNLALIHITVRCILSKLEKEFKKSKS